MSSTPPMYDNINAEVIAIGTEILLGELTDTNSVYIAQQLRNIGVNLYFMTSVGDNLHRIRDAIQIALSRADVVITCGGLGPTVDDMTRQAVADATERSLEFRQELLDQIAARFSRFRVSMTDNNRRQAHVPANALVIENPVGTAPAFAVEHKGKVVISVPGVPREMKYLMEHAVIPDLRERYRLGVIKARILKTAGIGESMLDERIGDDLLEASNPTVGLAAHNGYVDVRITAKAETLEAADQMIAGFETLLYSRIGDFIFGYDEDRIETVLISELKKRQAKITICEVGLGDAVSSAFMAAPDVVAQLVQYPDADALGSSLKLDPSVSMRELAHQAAQALNDATPSEVSIVVISTPDVDEQADKEETTVVLTRVGDRTRVRGYGFGGRSGYSREWVRTWSLSFAWRMLCEHYADEVTPNA
jgi:nicotinamide-nucleotide amidase